MFIAMLRLPCDHWKWPHFHTFVDEEQLSDYDSLLWKHLTQCQIRSGIMWSVSLSWTSKITQVWTIHSKSLIKENGKKFKKKRKEKVFLTFFFIWPVYTFRAYHIHPAPRRHAVWTEPHTLGAGASLRKMPTCVSEPRLCMWESHQVYCLKDKSLWAWKWMQCLATNEFASTEVSVRSMDQKCVTCQGQIPRFTWSNGYNLCNSNTM